MNLLTIFLVVAIVIVFARYLPIRKVVLVEGIFDCEKTEFNFRSERKDRVWYFKYPCRLCWTRGRDGDDWAFKEWCPVVIPRRAINPSSLTPRKGDSIAITAGKSILGKVVLFRIVPTDYKDEFAKKELLEPGKDFLLREHCIKMWTDRHHRLTHEGGMSRDCITADAVAAAEKESFIQKAEPFDFLPQDRKTHVESCDWCKKLLLRD